MAVSCFFCAADKDLVGQDAPPVLTFSAADPQTCF